MDFEDFLREWNAIAKKLTKEGRGDGELQDTYDLQLYAANHRLQTLQQVLEAHYEKAAMEECFLAADVFDHRKSMETNWEDLNSGWVMQLSIFLEKYNLELPPYEDEEIEKVDESFYDDSKDEAEIRDAIGMKELPKQKAAPENVREEAAAQQLPEGFPRTHEEALARISEISNRLSEFVNTRRETRDLLQSRADVSNAKPTLDRIFKVVELRDKLNRKLPSLQQDLEKVGDYLNYRDERVFDKNARKALRKLQADIQTNLDKKAALDPKITTEIANLAERRFELRDPVGSGHGLKGAVDAFKAIQDKQLSFGRTGGHANEFNAVKEAVQALDDYPGKADKMAVYNACYAYLSKHTVDGSHIKGQKSEVGRLRKQAVVNLLEVLSRDPDVKEELAEVEKNEPNRMKLNFAELEKSLAKKTGMQKVDNKYLLGTKRKAYAELNAEKQRAEAAPAARRPR